MSVDLDISELAEKIADRGFGHAVLSAQALLFGDDERVLFLNDRRRALQGEQLISLNIQPDRVALFSAESVEEIVQSLNNDACTRL